MRKENSLGAKASPDADSGRCPTASSNESHSQHSPLPWRVDGCKGSIYQFDIVGPNGEDLAYANESDGADEPSVYPAQANADFIVRACNSHDELLAALKAYRASCRKEWGAPTVQCECAQCQAADAAIANAEAR